MPDSVTLRYLPFEAGRQVFGIRMSDVVAVRRLTSTPTHTKQVDGETPEENSLPVIDLCHLLWGEKATGQNQPVIIISAGNATAALLVDSVMPIRTADDNYNYPYPKLARFENCFFDRVVNEQEGLVLLFDVVRLLDRLGAASPTLLSEGVYAG
ncbi:MAG: chemotaxis protein CheW [Anaerolineae bacterium]|nr:chemotaxis protein CheW [Anaerolineae bacterium]